MNKKPLIVIGILFAIVYLSSLWNNNGNIVDLVDALPATKIFFLVATIVLLWLAPELKSHLKQTTNEPPLIEVSPAFEVYPTFNATVNLEPKSRIDEAGEVVRLASESIKESLVQLKQVAENLKQGEQISAATWLIPVLAIEKASADLEESWDNLIAE